VQRTFRLGDLAARVGGRVVGDPERELAGVATLDGAGPHELSFLTNPRYRNAARASEAGAILVGTGVQLEGPDLLVVPEPYVALAEILELFHPEPAPTAGISPDARVAAGARLGPGVAVGPFAVIDDACTIGERVRIGAGVVIGERSAVGADSVLHPRAVLYPGTRVGKRCVIHSGVVLGADGFGFATLKDGRHRKIPQVGRVVVEDDVEIGANTTIDRAALGETVVGEGTKIDNLVMVGHGARVGRHVLLVAQAGLAGSARLGDRATIAAQSGVAGHLDLPAGLVLAAKSALLSQPEPDARILGGIPAVDLGLWRKSQAIVKRLPELRSEVKRLRERLEELERRLGEGGEC